jgi:hypothetical protein
MSSVITKLITGHGHKLSEDQQDDRIMNDSEMSSSLHCFLWLEQFALFELW